MNITEKLQKNVMTHLIEEPIIDENYNLINKNLDRISNILEKKKINNSKYHYLQLNGIKYLLLKLKKHNLKYIPTDVLRNKIQNIDLYIYLINDLDESNIDIVDIIANTYEKSLFTLNYLINLKND